MYRQQKSAENQTTKLEAAKIPKGTQALRARAPLGAFFASNVWSDFNSILIRIYFLIDFSIDYFIDHSIWDANLELSWPLRRGQDASKTSARQFSLQL